MASTPPEVACESAVGMPLQLGAAEIARRISDGSFTAEQIVSAAVSRLRAAQQTIRPLTTERFDQAVEEARRADRRQQRGHPLGLLHGVPVTVKECLDVAGLPTTWGNTGAASPARHDAEAVRQLKAAGAIVVAKTNVSQQGLFFESDNPRYGQTCNPWDVQRTCGGSSGGEAVAVAIGGSALGLATDLGGSIRVPAHFCGVHGLKPTAHAISTKGFLDNFAGMEAIACVPGPMARTVEDLTLALNVLADRQQLGRWQPDPAVCVPTRISPASLNIGWWEDDGYFTPSPAIRRAIREAVEELAAWGAKLQPWSPPRIDDMMQIYFGLMSADGGASLRQALRNSQRHPQLNELQRLAVLPGWFRTVAAAVLDACDQRDLAQFVSATGRKSAAGYWELCRRARAWQADFQRSWEQAALSSVLFPAFGLPAFHHGHARDALSAASYAFLANLLGYPAGTLSLTRVKPHEQRDREIDRQTAAKFAAACARGSSGLPVGVQIMAPPWREDIVLAVMRALEIRFRYRPDYPVACLMNETATGTCG